MQAIVPYLSLSGNCAEALDFYANALEGTVAFKTTFGENAHHCTEHWTPKEQDKNKIMHASITSAALSIMLSDCPSEGPSCCPASSASASGSKVTLNINFDKEKQEVATRVFNKLAEGGKIVMPLNETFWAELYGLAVDKFGFSWSVNISKACPASASASSS